MVKNKEDFYVAKGEKDSHPWLYYGEEAPIIDSFGNSTAYKSKCNLVGSFDSNIIADSIKDNEIVKIYIRKQTKKNK